MSDIGCNRHGGSNRRMFLADLGQGFAGLALGAMLARDGIVTAGEGPGWQAPDGQPHFTPKAKSVIWLFMNGGMSHLESFDHKPEINKYGGMSILETPYADTQKPEKLKRREVAFNVFIRHKIWPLQIGFKKYGESGIEVADWLPHIGSCIDDIAVIRSMYTTDDNHGAQTQFHSGRHVLDGDFPCLGAWVNYGLGSINENLPQYISMGNREYWNAKDGHYLGPAHDAVPLRIDPANPLDYSKPSSGLENDEQQLGFDFVNRMNRLKRSEYPNDPALTARIKAYELAFRMQTSIPEALVFDSETKDTQEMYGINEPDTKDFGSKMLACRRLVERGVRFIQVQHGAGGAGAWDAHYSLKAGHAITCKQVDKPVAALLKDLKQRGLLESTLVCFLTEFGRTPAVQPAPPGQEGRDHHPYGFSVWMAGGGLKGGIVHGATDEIGFHAVEHRHYVTDVHATIMKQLGLDSRRLEIPGQKRLEVDHGKPIDEIIA